MKSDFYVYAYYVPGEFLPFYIGKGRGNRFKTRLYGSCGEASGMMKNKLLKLKREGIRPLVLKLYTNLTEEKAFEKERMLIKLYGRRDIGTGCLCNHTDGGEGQSGRIFSEESRKKMSESHKGKKPTPEANANMIAAVLKVRARPVELFDVKTSEVVERYVSVREAGRKLGVGHALIGYRIRRGLMSQDGQSLRYAERCA
jgi:hypothetical protein